MRRAKIVCTLGPATSSYEQIKQLIESGMNVARLNMSHGEHAVHAESYANVRRAARELGRGVGIVADLQGPKIRLGRFADGPVMLDNGAEFTITTEDVLGDVTQCGTTHKGLPGDCQAGDTLLIDDGKVKVEVIQVDGPRVVTRVLEGGPVSNNKGINLPGANVSVPALSEKDKDDLRWALRIGVDMVFLSFVRNGADVDDVHAIMDEMGRRIPVLAKVEKPQAVENLADIVAAFDGVMVARGDLGVELPLQEVPIVQKRAIQMCREANKPVIVATQMLESMMENTRPTRAEASDVANAVLDGADAVMLSGETSVGKHPNIVVQTMASIVQYAEENGLERMPKLPKKKYLTIGEAVTKSAVDLARRTDASFIASFTETGRTAREVASSRPKNRMLAFTPSAAVQQRLSVVWGVDAFLVPPAMHTDQMVEQIDAELLASGLGKAGELVIIIAGVPPGVSGTTNGLRVHTVGAGSVERALPS
ncbi:MAG TPA: pyruvate kinase [Candidatus Nanopelagicales bacterium]